MRTLRTVEELRGHLDGVRRAGRTIGLVPTMGAFHEGHLELMRAARASCDEVVVSLFVNPAQFDDAGDLHAYPRQEAEDAAMAAAVGVDVLFAPPVEEVYPDGFATTVSVGAVAAGLEGAHRPGHFDGVATVVTKLFNMAGPDVAFFGRKDAQQAALIRKLVRDLDLPVRIEVLPTVREPDGLALSSRNARLSRAERGRASALHAGLRAAAEAAAEGERDAGRLTEIASANMRSRGVDPEYVSVVDPDTFEELTTIEAPALIAVAARVGQTRLIDNITLLPTLEVSNQ